MSDQPYAGRKRDPELSLEETVQDSGCIAQLRGEGVVAEPFGESKVSGVIHPTAAEVETHRRKACSGEAVGQRGKHPPVLEAFIAVQHHYRRTGGGSASSADVDQDGPQAPGQ